MDGPVWQWLLAQQRKVNTNALDRRNTPSFSVLSERHLSSKEKSAALFFFNQLLFILPGLIY